MRVVVWSRYENLAWLYKQKTSQRFLFTPISLVSSACITCFRVPANLLNLATRLSWTSHRIREFNFHIVSLDLTNVVSPLEAARWRGLTAKKLPPTALSPRCCTVACLSMPITRSFISGKSYGEHVSPSLE